jgi:predicted transglutaminase-like cysteine proteinase
MGKQVKSVDVIEQNIFANTIKSADELISKLTALNTEFKVVAETTKEVIKAGKFDSVKSLNDFNKATENATKLLQKQLQVQNELNKASKLKAEIEDKQAATTLKNEKIESERLKRTIQQTKETERLTKATERETQKQTALSSAYGRVNKMLNSLRSEYRDLAIRKELGAKLTEKEEFRYTNLQKRIDSFDKALKSVDASMGLHQRNVGNYKSGFDGLGMSINQLTREMPAFSNSLQTGFLAISNNLPMLFDELQKIKKANVELAATGQPTTSVFKQLASSIFSFQTLLSVGVTLLTIYGAKIIDWVSNALNPANKELEKLNERQKKQREYVGQESAEYVGLIMALKQTNAQSKERAKLIKEINDKFNVHIKNMKDEKEFQKQINNEVKDYIEYKKSEYRIKANEELIALNLAKQAKLTKELNDLQKQSKDSRDEQLQAELRYRVRVKQLQDQGVRDFNLSQVADQVGYGKFLELDRQINSVKRELEEANKRLNSYGFAIGKAKQWTDKYNDSKETERDKQKQINEYATKYFEILAKITALEEQRKVGKQQSELDKEVQKQLKNIQTTGDGEIAETYRILTEQNRLRQEARQTDYEASKKAREEDYNRKIREINKDLKQLEKAGKTDTDAYKQLQENKKAIKKEFDAQNKLSSLENEDAMKKITEDSLKELEAINKTYYDAISKYREQEDEDEKLKAEKKLQKQKDIFKQLDELAKFSADYFIKQSERKISMIDKQIDAMQKQNDYMQQLAANGNITAQQSLAYNNKLIIDANKEKAKELKKQERIKIAMTVFDAYNSNLQNKEVGGKNALVKTITDVSLLTAFVNSLPSFMDGTEDTGKNGKGIDGKGGFHAILHPNERVIPKELNSKMGGISNFELSTIAEDYLRGNIINKYDTAINTNWNANLLVSEIRDLKNIIQNKPETNIEMGEIVGGVMKIVESTRVNNTTIRNIHRFNKKI